MAIVSGDLRAAARIDVPHVVLKEPRLQSCRVVGLGPGLKDAKNWR